MEFVPIICFARAAYGTLRLAKMYTQSLRNAKWPIITRAEDAVKTYYHNQQHKITCTQLSGGYQGIAFYGPDEEYDVPTYMFFGRTIVPMYLGNTEMRQGNFKTSSFRFNFPHDPQVLTGFCFDETHCTERYIKSAKTLQNTLAEWQVQPDVVDANVVPSLVKEFHFTDAHPLYCIYGPSFAGVSHNKSHLIRKMLWYNRGPFYLTSIAVGILSLCIGV